MRLVADTKREQADTDDAAFVLCPLFSVRCRCCCWAVVPSWPQVELDTSTWPRQYPTAIPRQHNGCDCGVFAAMYAERLGAGRRLGFTQQDMPYLRQKLTVQLVQKRVD